jgi:hypothetical protein
MIANSPRPHTPLRLLTLAALAAAACLLAACQSQAPTTSSGAAPLSDETAQAIMARLIDGEPDELSADLERVVEADDTRFIPVYIEYIRMAQMGYFITRGNIDQVIDALETLSGKTYGLNWFEWMEWYGATDIEPPPGFTTWKGQLLGLIDPNFEQFFDDDFTSTIRVEEITWGGVLLDGIPALDYPAMLAPEEAGYLDPDDPVFGVAINGEAHAYPLRIVDWHEMANDVVGGVPVSLAYCTLCGAAIAYDGRVPEGVDVGSDTFDFGSSGFLYRSNKLMYDRQTHTLWNQFTGEPVLGELAGSGIQLELLPVVLTTWQEWLAQHPETLVLDIDTGYDRTYDLGAPYGDYFSDQGTMFPVWQRSDLLEDKSQVYGLRLDSVPVAYPVETLAAEQVVNDQQGETRLVLVAQRGVVTANGLSLRAGPVTYSTGAEVRAYDRGEQTFSPGPTPDVVLDSAGREWQVTEEALLGPAGEQAPRINGHLAYWFGWYAFFPQTIVYSVDE